MIKTVYLDVDGVLADFIKHIHTVFSVPYDPLEKKPYVFWEAWKPPVSSGVINAICTESLWRALPWCPDGHDILRETVDMFGDEKIYLLTQPMPHPESATGRWKWIKEHLPYYYDRTIITRAPKSLFARPDALLIDDCDDNVEQFREAGGKAILIPRCTNKMHRMADRTLLSFAMSLAAIETMEDIQC
jgi:5'(3')-deoxyribonucleotidase